MTDHDVLLWEAYALKAAETALEKAMLDILKERIPAATKLAAVKRVLVTQMDVSIKYQRAATPPTSNR